MGDGRSALWPYGPVVPKEGAAPAHTLPVTPALSRGPMLLSKRYAGRCEQVCCVRRRSCRAAAAAYRAEAGNGSRVSAAASPGMTAATEWVPLTSVILRLDRRIVFNSRGGG